MSALTQIRMVAPTGVSLVQTRNGYSYTVDPDGNIVTVNAIDVADLMNAGFVLTGDSAEGRDNLSASTDPTPDDDELENYAVGSRWFNTTTGRVWTCVDATEDTAVWVEMGGTSAVVAALGTNQSTAAALIAGANAVTAGDGTKGVRLPLAVAGLRVRVINTAAAVLKVYPATGAAINALGANVAFALGQARDAEFVCSAALQWYCDAIAAATPSAAELDTLAGVTPGTSAASKAVVLDGNSKINALDITALSLGGVAVTADAAEVNKLDGTGAALASGTPVTHIADPAGGGTVDAESRTAIGLIIDALEAYGIDPGA